jgi:hypothetical protein
MIRVLDPNNIKDIAQRLGTERCEFLSAFENTVGETTIFALSAVAAIGEISKQEAIEGIIDFFRDKMREIV